MWPFKKDDSELTKEQVKMFMDYNDRSKPYNTPNTPPTRTCVTCGHLVAADRVVVVEHVSGTYTLFGRQLSTEEYFCEEHAPPWRKVYSHAGIVYQYARTRTQVTTYSECGQVLKEWYVS